ncbi:facilitated trehalose transporter Tret1-like [Chrysoperla carnea]|uniref:facilitated trehalose transporter Tret1-like n=1 Tax=Chrysoperla carnea TaxID=189513 RepID=UPI001D073D5A|nr:facilitated trehalose transporter Tret1-like [Chrysoperla carnea]
MMFGSYKKYFLQFAAATPALLTVLSFATHLGWTSPALRQYLSGEAPITLTSDEGSWFVSIISIGCIAGLLGMMLTSNIVGRKLTMVVVTVPLLAGWLLIIIAKNVTVLYIARLIAGFGMGMSATAVPIYTGEIATDDLRSALSSSFQIMLASGPIIEYSIVPFMTVTNTAALSAILPLVILLMIYWMPESPYYLLMKNKEDEAKKVLSKLRGSTEVDNELSLMKKTVKYQMANRSTFIELFRRRNNRRGLFIMFGMYTIQASCGTVVILFYAHVIFEKIHFDKVSPNILALLMIILPCVSSCISTGLVEHIGKKPLLIVSLTLCFLCMLCIGLFFHFQSLSYDVMSISWLPAMCLIGFKFVHGLGIAGIPFIQLGELFSANIKVHAVCTCKCYLFILHFCSNKLFQILSDNLGFFVPFYIFAGFSLFGVVFTIFCVPETTGKSLHEIQLLLGAKYADDANAMNNTQIKDVKVNGTETNGENNLQLKEVKVNGTNKNGIKVDNRTTKC